MKTALAIWIAASAILFVSAWFGWGWPALTEAGPELVWSAARGDHQIYPYTAREIAVGAVGCAIIGLAATPLAAIPFRRRSDA